ncbi:MAG: helix-turn-helix domain-containing protein [Vallitalea sp.]|jgi:transcriptional regulator with XRE-family HTH domain|nr:helix-turn-helix domain-containing protein [Vallitalea sp.]
MERLIRITRLREVRQLTQYELAKMVGISRVELSKIERGTVDPRLSTVKSIAKALNVRIDCVVSTNNANVNYSLQKV